VNWQKNRGSQSFGKEGTLNKSQSPQATPNSVVTPSTARNPKVFSVREQQQKSNFMADKNSFSSSSEERMPRVTTSSSSSTPNSRERMPRVATNSSSSTPKRQNRIPKAQPKSSSSNSRRSGDNSTRRAKQKTKKTNLAPKKVNLKIPPLPKPFILALRVVVISVGISAILGTVFSFANSSPTQEKSVAVEATQAETKENDEKLKKIFSEVKLGEEVTSLKTKLQDLAGNYPQLEPGVFLLDLDSNDYVSLEGATPRSSASTIKLPILVAFLQDLDAGKVSLDQQLIMTEDVIGSGSGNMQYEKPGSRFTALETASRMISISDNTATNMLIKLLGGQEVVNRRFLEWGLNTTVIRNPLPDLEGTNTTTPEDLANVLAKVERGELISLRSRDRFLQIMRTTVTNTLLPQGLEEDAIIAHKTGDIRSVLGDAGIIDMPNGKRYIAAVLVKRPDNSPEAKEMIQKISKIAYQHFKWSKPNPFLEDESFTN
jgi:beta-lactamase class A